MRILIGLDDSPFSERALEFVAGTRWPAGSSMLVASAARPIVLPYAEPDLSAAGVPDQAMNDEREHCGEIVKHAGARLRGVGLATETRVLEGDPRDALVETALAEHADLIVVGSHGRSGIAKMLLGSVANHVVTHAPCSVLVVKRTAAS